MAVARISRGTHILYRGHEYIIEKQFRNRDLQIKNVATNEYLTVKESEFIIELFEGHLEFISSSEHRSHANRKSIEFVVEELSLLDADDPIEKIKKEKLKKETIRKYRYVSQALKHGLTTLTAHSLHPIIDKIKIEINDSFPPSWQTLRLWVKAYLASDEDVRVLVPRDSRKGNYTSKFGCRTVMNPTGDKAKFTDVDEERAKVVEEIIKQAVKDIYLNEERHSVQEVVDEVEAKILEDNRYRKSNEQLPVPAPSSIYRAVARLNQYEVDKARYGRRYADQKHESVGRGPRPTRPLEVVQMDSTTLDLFVVDSEMGMPIGRPTFFGAIDVGSKMMTGYYNSFNDTGYLAVMQCLLHSIKPKTYVKERYPDIKHDWNCYGLMESLKVDNALAFHGESLEDASLQLGFLIDYAPIATPWYKASIERYIGTNNRRLIHRLPGTTFSNIFQKKGYDPLKHAVITKETLEEILHVFAIDIYPRQLHRGINDVPARLWAELIEKYPPTLPKKVSDLKVLLGHVVWRTVQKTGIEIDGLYYRSDELAALRSRMMNRYGKVEKRVKIKKNPEDLSLIYVQDELKGLYLQVPAEDQAYTKGLTQFQHDIFRTYARERAKDYVNIEDLVRAKEYIRQLVMDEWNNSRKNVRGVRVARFLNHGRTSDEIGNANAESNSTPEAQERIQPKHEAKTGR